MAHTSQLCTFYLDKLLFGVELSNALIEPQDRKCARGEPWFMFLRLPIFRDSPFF
jgi:hypothetical protein